MAKASSTAKGTATVVAKVIRADGTEQTFVAAEVTVTDANAVAAFMAEMVPEVDTEAQRANEAIKRNEDESRRNAEANERAAKEAK